MPRPCTPCKSKLFGTSRATTLDQLPLGCRDCRIKLVGRTIQCARVGFPVGEARAGHGVGRPGALRMSCYGLEEIVAIQGVEQGVRMRSDRRGTGDLPEERDLAEEVAPSEFGHGTTGLVHRYFAFLDDVEAIPWITLANDLGSRCSLGGDQTRGDPLQL